MSSSSAVRTPIVKQIDVLPLHIPGSLVWESTSQALYISTDKKWVQVGPSAAQNISSEPTIGMRTTTSASVQATNVQAFKFLQMPAVATITNLPLQEPGGIVLASDTRKVHISTSQGWIPVGQVTSINSVGSGESLISSFTASTYNFKSLVAGPGIALSTNLAGTELTITNNGGGGGGVSSVTTGAGITNTGTPSNVNLVNTGVITTTTGAGISNTGTASNVNLVNTGVLSITPSSGLSNSGTAQNPVLLSTATFASEPTGVSAFSGVSTNTINPTAFRLKTFTEGTGVTITSTGTNLTFSVSSAVLSVTAGPGISVTGTATNPIINNTGVLTIVANTGVSNTGTAQNPVLISTATIASEPTGVSSFSAISSNNVNPTAFKLKTFTQGSGITILSTGTDLAFSASGFVVSVSAGPGITITGTGINPIINNAGVLSVTANTGVSNTGTASNPILISTATLTSEPTGVSSFSAVSGNNVNPTAFKLKTISEGSNVTIVSTSTDLSIGVSGVVISVTAGPGISITGTASNPIINNTGVLSVTANTGISNTGTASNPILISTATLTSEPTGVSTFSAVSTNNVNPTAFVLKTVTQGSNISIVSSGTDLAFSVTGVVLSVAAGTGISITGTATNPIVNNTGVISLTANTGISNTGTATNPVLISTATLTSEPTGVSTFSVVSTNNVNPTSFVLKTITQGSNLTITPTGTDLSISVSGVVLSVSGGSGISITGTATNPIVNNAGVLSVTAGTGMANSGTAQNPVLDNTGVLTFTAGTGISNTGTPTNPIVNNTGVLSISVTSGITNTGTASNPILNNTTTLVSEPAAGSSYSVVSSNSVNPTTLTTKTITAGTNVNITSTGTDLTINAVPASGITGFSAMKSGTQTFTYVGPNPVGGVITQYTTSGAFNFDTSGGAFNSTSGVYTVPASGIYSITANVSITPNTNQDSYYLIVRVNGVTDAYRTDDQPSSNISLVTTLRLFTNANFTIGDTVEIVVLDSVAVIGSSFTVSSSPDTWFSILKL